MAKRISKPKYLSLTDQAKTNTVENIVSDNPEESTKSLAQECLIFVDNLEKKLKDPVTKLQEIKKLFEIHVENLKKANPAQ